MPIHALSALADEQTLTKLNREEEVVTHQLQECSQSASQAGVRLQFDWVLITTPTADKVADTPSLPLSSRRNWTRGEKRQNRA